MVPCLHQGNLYIKRKLRVWRAQKCNLLVGANTAPTSTGPQNSHVSYKGLRIGPPIENGGNSGEPIAMVPCLHQGNLYIKRKLRVWRAQKCNLLVGANTAPTCARARKITMFRTLRIGPPIENGGKFGWTDRHGTLFAPRQCLYQKEATGMESPEM